MRTRIEVLNAQYTKIFAPWSSERYVVVKALKREIPNFIERWIMRERETATYGWAVLEHVSYVTYEDTLSGSSSGYWKTHCWFAKLEDAQQFKSEVSTTH